MNAIWIPQIQDIKILIYEVAIVLDEEFEGSHFSSLIMGYLYKLSIDIWGIEVIAIFLFWFVLKILSRIVYISFMIAWPVSVDR